MRGTGQPYTKRMLPEHLIPRSPFFSEGLVKLLQEGRDQYPGFNDAACEALGCIDPRTARRHLHCVRELIVEKTVTLAAILAMSTGKPVFIPGTNPVAVLQLFWNAFLSSLTATSGTLAANAAKQILWLSPSMESWCRGDTWKYFNRSCIPLAQPP